MDRELFIRVAASIEKLRATIRDEESSLQRNHQRLAEMEAKLDEMLAAAKASGAPGASLFEWRGAPASPNFTLGVVARSTGVKSALVPTVRSANLSIIGLVRRFFEINPTTTFTAQDDERARACRTSTTPCAGASSGCSTTASMRERDGAYS